MKKIEGSFMAKLFFDVCNRLGHKLIMGPKMGAYGQIESSNNKRISFYNCCFDINGYGSSITTRNKGLTRLILEPEKINMPKGKYFSLDNDKFENCSSKEMIDTILKYSKKLNFPLMVKGADLHRGSCIYKVSYSNELLHALKESFKKTKGIVVEEFIDYPAYRILVFNGKVVACYRKDPFHIIGNGKTPASQLITKSKKHVQEVSIGTNFKEMEEEIGKKLKEEGYSMDTIIPKNKKIILTDSASISKGGIAVDCLDCLNEKFKRYCKKICNLVNLNLCGIDMVIKDIDKAPNNSYFLEANSSPCLETYSLLGIKQYIIIEKLMESIIKKSINKKN